MVRAKELVGDQSKVLNPQTGTAKPYLDDRNIDLRVFSSKEHFDMVDAQFKDAKDLRGNSMMEIARRYWDDPDFQEKLRQEIAEGKRRVR